MNNKVLNEGLMLPIEQEEILNYIKEESNNIKTSIDHLELDDSTATLVENGKAVSFKTEDGKAVLFVEDYIRKEINDFLMKF